MSAADEIRIGRWGPDHLSLLEWTMGDARMTEYLGGPESDENLAERHVKYQKLARSGRAGCSGSSMRRAVASVGRLLGQGVGGHVYEIGWLVVPEAQGRGVASMATSHALARAKDDGKHRCVHAFPSVENLASNTICRKLGFELLKRAQLRVPARPMGAVQRLAVRPGRSTAGLSRCHALHIEPIGI